MSTGLPEAASAVESEVLERKSALNPTDLEDRLTLINTVVAMANTSGGHIVIGSVGKPIPASHLPLFDSARLDDQVNTYVEPRIEGIKSFTESPDFIMIEVPKGKNPPHVFRQNGNFEDANKKQKSVFRKGDVRVRHSSKTELATRDDFDRMFREQEQRLFEKVKIVFDAGPNAEITVSKEADLKFRLAPDDPTARPVKELLTPEPFRDFDQEMIGAVKAWKTSGQLLNEAQICKAYARRDAVTEVEVLALLLQSCWEKYLPGYCWATRLSNTQAAAVIRSTLESDKHPSALEALKIAVLLPIETAQPLIEIARKSKRDSIRNQLRRLEPVLRAKGDKNTALEKAQQLGQSVTYYVDGKKLDSRITSLDKKFFELVLAGLAAGEKRNRYAFKAVELRLFAGLIGRNESA